MCGVQGIDSSASYQTGTTYVCSSQVSRALINSMQVYYCADCETFSSSIVAIIVFDTADMCVRVCV